MDENGNFYNLSYNRREDVHTSKFRDSTPKLLSLVHKRIQGRKFTIALFVVTKTGNVSSVRLQEPG